MTAEMKSDAWKDRYWNLMHKIAKLAEHERTADEIAQIGKVAVQKHRRLALLEAAQIAKDAESGRPAPGAWNDACAHIAQLLVDHSLYDAIPSWDRTPFANCSYEFCDLPGQCRSEGKCHHPKIAARPPCHPER